MRRRVGIFLGHLAASALLFALLTFLFMRVWFPMPYFLADGGWQGLRLVLGVDVTVGPLLSLVAASPKKARATLAKDLAIIGALQLLALGLGLWTLFPQRTSVVVYSEGKGYAVEAAQADLFGEGFKAIRDASAETPVLVVANFPKGVNERQELRRRALGGGKALLMLDEYFVPLGEAAREELAFSAEAAHRYVKKTPEDIQRMDDFLAELGGAPDDHWVFPVICRYETFFLALSRKSLAVEGYKRGIQVKL